MPQANDKLRDLVAGIIPPIPGHGNLVDCGDAEAYLIERGWKVRKGLMYAPVSYTAVQASVAQYLVDEWDYSFEGHHIENA